MKLPPRPFGDYIALYLPYSEKGDPSRRGFWTKRGAWKYIRSIEFRSDGGCKCCGAKDCDVYLYEWEVLKYKDYIKCETFWDIMEAAGHNFVKIYPLEEEK